jgi:hypothetical protein
MGSPKTYEKNSSHLGERGAFFDGAHFLRIPF